MGLDFSKRSTKTEIIDDVDLGRDEMDRVLANLAVINRFLGGYSTTIGAIERVLPNDLKTVRVLDVGAGGGDTARKLVEWGRATGRRVDVVAVDLSFAAVAFAHERLKDLPEASVVQADVLALPFGDGAFDVVLCSLFLHHFRQPVAARLLVAMHAAARVAVVVNDLHRNRLAYFGIWALTRLFPVSPIVRNDGPLSVMRAFQREDFAELVRATGLDMQVRWRWAFRYQVVILKTVTAVGEAARA